MAPLDEIVRRFKSFNARVLFAAEKFCWPDETLSTEYPSNSRGEPYLNSGGIIGYANDIYAIVSSSQINNNDDDQLFYTNIYLNEDLRKKHNIQLDHRTQIFQNLNGAIGKVYLFIEIII